jgi:hypothetical protein
VYRAHSGTALLSNLDMAYALLTKIVRFTARPTQVARSRNTDMTCSKRPILPQTTRLSFFTEKQCHINWRGSLLARHGYAVIILDTNDPRERREARAEALMAGDER